MKDANLVHAYVSKRFPDSRGIVEDYCSHEELLGTIHKAPADAYILSVMGDHEKSYLGLATEIRLRYENCSLLFVLNDFDDLKSIVNSSITPDYVFAGEVTEPELDRYFSMQEERVPQRSLLSFTLGNRKQIVSKQAIVSAQAAHKKVSLRALGRSYETTLTISALERLLPGNFVRIDKGVIINSDYISLFDSHAESIYLTDGQELPVSRRGRKRLFEAVKAN